MSNSAPPPKSNSFKTARTAHKNWAKLNYVNGRNLLTVSAVRAQIAKIVYSGRSEGGLGVDYEADEEEEGGVGQVSEGWDVEGFLHCVFKGVGGVNGGNISLRGDGAVRSNGGGGGGGGGWGGGGGGGGDKYR